MEQQLGVAVFMRTFLLALSLTAFVTCGRGSPQPPADQPQHSLLRTLKPPPLNQPVKVAPMPSESPNLPSGDEPTLLLLQEGRAFQGNVTASGRLIARNGRLEFLSQDKSVIQLLYRLPPGLPALPEVNANGDFTVVERPDPGGLNRRILARSDGSLLLAQVLWRSSKPVTLDLGSGLRLSQGSEQSSIPRSLLVAVQVEALDGEQAVGAIPIGKPTRIRTRTGVFHVFVETSHLASASGPTDKHQGRYIFVAWVVRSTE